MYVPRYTQLNLSADTAKAMVQAADLGTNIQRLYQHELSSEPMVAKVSV